MKILVALLMCLPFAACVSMNKEKCESTDWEAKGQSDGRNGHAANNFRKYQEACTSQGMSLDQEAYVRGYTLGITAYCTRANGIYVGAQGEDYHKQCPPTLETEFLLGYVEGKREFDRNALEKSKVEMISDALNPQKGPRCTFDSDCTVKGSCNFNQCAY